MSVRIRSEAPQDAAQIRSVNETAFGRRAEADLADALRARGAHAISLVAEQDGRVVGHILFTPLTLESRGRQFAAVGLAPIAVLPELQGQGIGSQLVTYGIVESRQAGYECILVLGRPDYYARFGFVAASRYGLRCEVDVSEEAFMALELYRGALVGSSGKVCYPPEFRQV
jgi:putative acetyltransferase